MHRLALGITLLFAGFEVQPILSPASAQIARGHHGVGHDELHHWYRTLKHPGTGYDCCDGKDCRPTSARIQSGSVEVLVDGEWAKIPEGSLVPTEPPDGRTHVCAPKGSWSPKVIFCVVLGTGA